MQKATLPESKFVPIQMNIIRKQIAKGIGKVVLTLKNGENDGGQGLRVFQDRRKEIPGHFNR